MNPFTNDELFAFLDGELPRDREEAIEAAAATDPELAARIAVVAEFSRPISRAGKVRSELPPPRTGRRPASTRVLSWATAALVFVCALLGSGLYRERQAQAQTSRSLSEARSALSANETALRGTYHERVQRAEDEVSTLRQVEEALRRTEALLRDRPASDPSACIR